jgi:hypothetical protein
MAVIRLQTATFGPVTIPKDTLTLVGSYTADADRALYVNLLIGGLVTDWQVFVTLTRAGFAETSILDNGSTRSGVYTGNYWKINYVGESELSIFSDTLFGNPAWTQPERVILVHTGDIINVYAAQSNGTSDNASGFLEFYGTETLAENAAAVVTAIMTGGTVTIDANIKQVNGVTVTGNGAGTPWGPV